MTTRTYRGGSLEELLPQIREELGDNAVVLRQRDGIVGGIGGFFGKRCVEVEAREAAPTPSLPPRAVINVYDTGYDSDDFGLESEDTDFVADEDVFVAHENGFNGHENGFNGHANAADTGVLALPSLMEEHMAEDSEAEPKPILRTIADQARPFADELARAVEDPGIERALVRAGLPDLIAADLVAEAESHWAPLNRDEPIAAHLSRVLANRIPVAEPWSRNEQGRRIALVGERGSGRTTAAVDLSMAFRRAGVNTAVLSLEPARSALRLFERVDLLDVPFEIAPGPEEARLAVKRLESAEVVVADTPAFGPGHGASIHHLAGLLEAFEPHEIHLVIGPGTTADRAWLLIEELRRSARVDRLLLAGGVTAGAAAALVTGVPVWYADFGTGLRPSEPAELAMALLEAA